jgi:hypothetical protein
MTALVALSGSGVAVAEEAKATPDQTQMALAAIEHLSLDSAFERVTSPKTSPAVAKLAGPTSMDCKDDKQVEIPETCVVTFDELLAAVPAAPGPP